MKIKSKVAEKMLKSPKVDWCSIATLHPLLEKQEAARELSMLAIECARAAEYLDHSGGIGFHRDAVKAQNARAAKVRKALGYTLHRSDVEF